MIANSHPKTSHANIYFWLSGTLTLVWVLLYIFNQPAWIQQIKEQVGLSPVLAAADDSFYNDRIDPIFEKYCTACHDDGKNKGRLRLDNYRQLSFGGRTDGDLTAQKNNLIVERMKLPPNHRLAMPPYGRERHKQAELALIELWLEKGGSGEMTAVDFPNAPAKARVIKFDSIDWQAIEDKRQPMRGIISELQHQFPHTIHYEVRTSHLLNVDFSLYKPRISDQALTALRPVNHLITYLDLKRSLITNNALPQILKMTALTQLNLTQTKVSASQMSELLTLPMLKKLWIDDHIMTDEIEQQFSKKRITVIKVNNPDTRDKNHD